MSSLGSVDKLTLYLVSIEQFDGLKLVTILNSILKVKGLRTLNLDFTNSYLDHQACDEIKSCVDRLIFLEGLTLNLEGYPSVYLEPE